MPTKRVRETEKKDLDLRIYAHCWHPFLNERDG